MASKDVKKEAKTEVSAKVKVQSCKETYTIPKTNDTIKLLQVITYPNYYVASINELLVVLFRDRDTYSPVAAVMDYSRKMGCSDIRSIANIVNIDEQATSLLKYLGCNMVWHHYLHQNCEYPGAIPCTFVKLVNSVLTTHTMCADE